MGVTNKDLGNPDETAAFQHSQAEIVKLQEFTAKRFTMEPGWRWSSDVKPTVKTDSCQVHHVGYVLSGRLHVATNDGEEAEIGPGEAYEIMPGHDGWVAGDEPLTTVEFTSP
jgi:mannose-6-phosphate isomerase-like protein (cupin superfamily)